MPRFHATSEGNVPFTAEEEAERDAEELAIANAPPPVPASVSPRQIRQALTRAGFRQLVESAVAGGTQDTKDWWEFATAFERQNPQVVGMGAALDVTPTQLDDLFIAAAAL